MGRTHDGLARGAEALCLGCEVRVKRLPLGLEREESAKQPVARASRVQEAKVSSR